MSTCAYTWDGLEYVLGISPDFILETDQVGIHLLEGSDLAFHIAGCWLLRWLEGLRLVSNIIYFFFLQPVAAKSYRLSVNL
jgi:hypothetical protein